MSDYPSLHLLIGGEQVSGGGRSSEDVLNPATGEILAALPHATKDDLDRALANAEQGFRDWRRTPADKRAAILTKAAGLIKERAGDIAQTLTREQGKPENIIERMITGKLDKFYQESCLLEQPFVKDNDKTIGSLIKDLAGKLGENVQISRFSRFQLGE